MRILLTADPELPVPPKTYGGIERIVDGLTQGLGRLGHDVGLVAHAESTTPAAKLFPWSAGVSRGAWNNLRNSWVLRTAVSAFQPDVIHSFSRLIYLFSLLRNELPKLMSYQRDPSRRTTGWARWFSAGRLQFTGCSEAICQVGRKAGGTWNAIPNFVNLNCYDFQPSVPIDAPLVFLSRIEAIKGTHLAIEVARTAGKRLLIAGNHADEGENGRYWREQIEPFFGRDGIEYVGPVDDRQKNKLLGAAAALLVPVQWDEPFGIVFVEALACGTPVISCPRGALPEIVRSGQEGYLCNTVPAMVSAVADITLINRATCRQRVERFFSMDVVVKQYEQLYETMLGRTHNS